MNIAVVGPGAIGCLVSAYLARAGGNVWVLDYLPERAALLRDSGITVEEERGRFQVRVHATANPAEIRSAEMLIVCVKAGDTGAAAARFEGAISAEAYLLTLQNGLGNVEKLSDCFGSERVLAGVTSHGATLLEVGRVRHAGYGEIFLGEPEGANLSPAGRTKLKTLASVMNHAGLQARVVDNISLFIWRKLVVNVGINALTAILGVSNGRLLEIPDCQMVKDRAVTEAVQAAVLCGISLQVSEEIERVREVCRSTATNISSMLQDVRRRKRTEVDQINGAVVQVAARHGVDFPVNRVLTALVKGLEEGYRTN